MRVMTGKSGIKLAENLVEDSSLTVTHLSLDAGQDVPEHHAPYDVLVIPVKGRVAFTCAGETAEICPGTFVRMGPDEPHALHALEPSELMVVKMRLA